MGAVQVQTYNEQLMNIARYNNIKKLKQLYRNLSNLLKLAAMGDAVAASIYVDLSTALYECNVVTINQKRYIIAHVVENLTLLEVSQIYDRDISVIHESVNAGLKRLSRYLTGGEPENDSRSGEHDRAVSPGQRPSIQQNSKTEKT